MFQLLLNANTAGQALSFKTNDQLQTIKTVEAFMLRHEKRDAKAGFYTTFQTFWMPFDCYHKSTDCCEKGMCHQATGKALNTSGSGFVALILKHYTVTALEQLFPVQHHRPFREACLSLCWWHRLIQKIRKNSWTIYALHSSLDETFMVWKLHHIVELHSFINYFLCSFKAPNPPRTYLFLSLSYSIEAYCLSIF